MALVKSTLSESMSAMIDTEHPSHKGHPENNVDAAKNWANAICDYAATVTPVATPIAVEAAKAAFEAAVFGLITSQTFIVGIPAAFTTYAAALGAGMSPSFVATPPPTPIVLDAAWAIGLAGGKDSEIAKTLTTIIDTWFRTGTATPSVGGAPVLWS